MPMTLFPGMAILPFLQSVEVSQLLTEGAGTLILLAAAILVYRSFRERYLGIWIAGWVLYSAYRETAIASEYLNPGQLLTGYLSTELCRRAGPAGVGDACLHGLEEISAGVHMP